VRNGAVASEVRNAHWGGAVGGQGRALGRRRRLGTRTRAGAADQACCGLASILRQPWISCAQKTASTHTRGRAPQPLQEPGQGHGRGIRRCVGRQVSVRLFPVHPIA